MIFIHLLLAFQLENYKNSRFLRFIYTHPRFWIFGSKRQTLEYTQKAKLLLILTCIFVVIDIGASVYFLSGVWEILNVILVFFFIPIYFVVSNIIISPLDTYLKNKIIKKAQNKMKGFPKLQVIAITGSYGKTTTKEILTTILNESFHVLSTEGTKNTPLGISRLILQELNDSHQIFIVEMGAYERGNIKELCDITGPNISILTGITLQHLERFGSLDEIIDTKFEILESLRENDFAVVDDITPGVKKGLVTKTLSVKNIQTIPENIPYKYKENLGGTIFTLDNQEIDTKLLGNYGGRILSICKYVSQYLGQDSKAFQTGVSKIDFTEHRMQLIYNTQSNVFIIDDSFNGNLEGIRAILDLMKHAPFSGRKILIAGGIVELGDKTQEVHYEIGKEIGTIPDMILLVQGPIGNALKSGLLEAGYPKQNLRMYSTPLLLHEDLKNITQSGDMIVFQNDLPDHYL